MSLVERFHYLRDHGNYLDSRWYNSYRIHLYEAEGFYTEVWMRTDLNQVCWIEVAEAQQVADNYAGSLDVRKSLGI